MGRLIVSAKSNDAYAQLINPMTKYVASRTISEPLTWNSHLLEPDLAKGVAALKDRLSGDLIVYGCGQLANDLARSGLVDEVRFWLHPYVWGAEVRPFQPGELPVRAFVIPCLRELTVIRRKRLGHFVVLQSGRC